MFRSISFVLLFLAAAALVATSAHAADGSAGGAQQVIERFNLEEASTPISERSGWRKPKRILVAGFGLQMVAALKTVAPEIEFVNATAADLVQEAANVDAVIGADAP